jgi:hypothetical protein
MVLDIFLLLVAVGVIALASAEGVVRASILLLCFYMLCVVIGLMILGFDIVTSLTDLIVGSIGSGGAVNRKLYQSTIFLGLLIPLTGLAYALSHITFKDTQLTKLKWGDNILGTLVGVLTAILVMALLCNTWGVIVSERWRPQRTWQRMWYEYQTSFLRPWLNRVLVTYRGFVFPFEIRAYPVFFIPQN